MSRVHFHERARLIFSPATREPQLARTGAILAHFGANGGPLLNIAAISFSTSLSGD
jgi:hypothetical protein